MQINLNFFERNKDNGNGNDILVFGKSGQPDS